MFKITIRANIFYAIFIIVVLISILSTLIYNRVIILNNSFITGNGVNDITQKIYDKADIIVNSIKEYNSNGDGFVDIIGCPTNITMSGTTMSGSNISSNITYLNGKIYCKGNYNGGEFFIYFDNNYSTFLQTFYNNDIVNIVLENENFIGEKSFLDLDKTQISFTNQGTQNDNLDDNFNSDNYRIDSSNGNYYPNGFQDDDAIPRKTIFGNVLAEEIYNNIYWNNYKTNNIISENTNNNDNINFKASLVEKAMFYIDMSDNFEKKYDLIIFEFNQTEYSEYNTILPVIKYEGINLSLGSGYIQNNSGNITLSKEKTGNEFLFDIKNKNYGIFITNKTNKNIVYNLSATTLDGKGIYISPVDDSKDGITVIANNIFVDGDKNFIGENIKITNKK